MGSKTHQHQYLRADQKKKKPKKMKMKKVRDLHKELGILLLESRGRANIKKC